MKKIALLVLVCASAIGCAKGPDASKPAPEKKTMSPDASDYGFAGTATMEADGTLVLELRSYDDRIQGIAHGLLRYPKTHPQYASIAQHVGPIGVGETKPIKPFP
jgi:hypothetical protein